jgi:hypothetical protein
MPAGCARFIPRFAVPKMTGEINQIQGERIPVHGVGTAFAP